MKDIIIAAIITAALEMLITKILKFYGKEFKDFFIGKWD
jgi:hypothetical protein